MRVEYEGACYHVFCRGDRREAIVRTDADRQLFLSTLEETCSKTGWRVHAYVLMPNHYHLLLETPEANLVAGMRWFQSTYTARFNRRHGLVGHLFQGRYKSLLVEAAGGDYLATVSTYIHMNPVRARLVGSEDAAGYAWSSVRGYLRPRERPAWLVAERVLGTHGLEDTPAGRRRYVAYLVGRGPEERRKGGGAEKAYDAIRRGWCFGGEAFRGRIVKAVAGKGVRARGSYSGGAITAHDADQAEALIEDEVRRMGLTIEEMQRLSWRDPRKKRLAQRVRGQTVVTNAWVAERLGGGHDSTVSRAVHDQR